MRLSPKLKLLFLSNPKCGSTTIRKILDEHVGSIDENYVESRKRGQREFWNHMTALELKPFFDKYNWDWDSFLKFTTIRNPFSKAVSNYFFCKPDANGTAFYRPGYHKETAFKMTFTDWVKVFCSDEKSIFRVENFCYDDAGECLVDHIIKMEEIAERLPGILKKAGIRVPLVPVKNKTEHRPYWEYYDEKTRKIVEDFFAEDIRIGDYRFGE